MRILIAGGHGQLARAFSELLPSRGHLVFAPAKDEFDITDPAGIRVELGKYRPDLLINCAAYNHVDNAESNYAAAYGVNAAGPKNLAIACAERETFFVHYSTDYVFDGTREGLYTEDDIPRPINKYGESKLAGEKFVADSLDRYLLFRTSWVYGKGGQNFLQKLREWSAKQQVLKVVADQISVPTYAADIASATMEALAKGLTGLYHLTNSGYASRYEVARYFLGQTGSASLVLPVTSDKFPSPATRPYFSAMSSRRLETLLGHGLPAWEDAMDRYIKSLGTAEAAG